MKISLKKNELLFEGEFILDNAEEIKSILSKLLSKIKTKEIKLNLINVMELDSAGLQIILSFCKTIKEKGIDHSVSEINEDISVILKTSGLGRYLNLA